MWILRDLSSLSRLKWIKLNGAKSRYVGVVAGSQDAGAARNVAQRDGGPELVVTKEEQTATAQLCKLSRSQTSATKSRYRSSSTSQLITISLRSQSETFGLNLY